MVTKSDKILICEWCHWSVHGYVYCELVSTRYI